jgi:hypothetical protein
MSSTSRRAPRKNLATVLALGTDSHLLASGQSVEDLIEVVPGRRPDTLQSNAVGGVHGLCRGRHPGLDKRRRRRRSSSTCTSITAINIDRSRTATEQCLATGRQVVLVVTREPTGPEVVVDGVFFHVVHHGDLFLKLASAAPFLNGARPHAPSPDLHETCKHSRHESTDLSEKGDT